jgi:hypothetical protein
MRRSTIGPAALALALGVLPLGAEPAGWSPFSSPDGRFSVQLPDSPQHRTEQAPDARLPTPLTAHTFISFDGRRNYAVSYVDYPKGFKGDVNSKLTGLRETFLQRIKGKLVSSKRVKYRRGKDVLPADEFSAVEGNNEYTALTVLDGERPYQVVAVIPKDEAAEAAPDVKAYFASFKIAPR